MAFILHIETSGTNCSVAISKQGILIDCIEKEEQNIHASALTIFIDELIKNNQLSYSQIDAIAVSKGPGSYTGLRIGVSTAKGLCYALDKPLIATSTLLTMAKMATKQKLNFNETMLLCPMIDARRMEVYTCLFDQHLQTIKDISAEILEANTFDNYFTNHSIVFFGDGAEKAKPLYQNQTGVSFIDHILPSAAYMIEEAYEKYQLQQFESVAYFEPFYLKEFLFKQSK